MYQTLWTQGINLKNVEGKLRRGRRDGFMVRTSSPDRAVRVRSLAKDWHALCCVLGQVT